MNLMKLWLGLFAIAALGITSNANAEQIECLELQQSATIELKLTAEENFDNCFYFDGIPQNTEFQFVAYSPDNVTNKITVYDLDAYGSATYIAEYISDPNSANGFKINSTNRRLAFKIKPTSHIASDKVLDVTFGMVRGIAAVIVAVRDVPAPVSNNPPFIPPEDPPCIGVRCVKPRFVDPVAPIMMSTTSDSVPACSGNQQSPPPPDNFDINHELAGFDKAMFAMTALGLDFDAVKALYMVAMFAPGQPYDIKNNQTFIDTRQGTLAELADFGNWFYGAAANRMGYTTQEALAAAAIVQQFTNIAGADNLSEAATGVLTAIETGQWDNPEDPPQISGGYGYAEDIYQNDPNRSTNSDSCHPESGDLETEPTSPGGEPSTGSGGSWGGGIFIGGGSCWGNCNRGRVTVTDVTDCWPDCEVNPN
jgi:hypothetical protein